MACLPRGAARRVRRPDEVGTSGPPGRDRVGRARPCRPAGRDRTRPAASGATIWSQSGAESWMSRRRSDWFSTACQRRSHHVRLGRPMGAVVESHQWSSRASKRVGISVNGPFWNRYRHSPHIKSGCLRHSPEVRERTLDHLCVRYNHHGAARVIRRNPFQCSPRSPDRLEPKFVLLLRGAAGGVSRKDDPIHAHAERRWPCRDPQLGHADGNRTSNQTHRSGCSPAGSSTPIHRGPVRRVERVVGSPRAVRVSASISD